MCTVTAERRPDGWRVTMNRDELRTRSQGEPPSLWKEPRILAPRDPDAGGTWIGVRQDGTWACLLNGYLQGEAREMPEPQTRGRIIPMVLRADDCLDAVRSADLSRTRSFRLWLGTDQGITDVFWDEAQLVINDVVPDPYALVTSSSLRQDDVKRVRRKAFEEWVSAGAPHAQNGLPLSHVERAGLDPEEAILMSRDYSHTISCTQITIDRRVIQMQHWLTLGAEQEPDATLKMSR